MTDVQPNTERRLKSRESEKEQLRKEYKTFKTEYLPLQKKKEVCQKLKKVAVQLDTFLSQASEIVARQQKQENLPANEDILGQARALEVTRSDEQSPEAEALRTERPLRVILNADSPHGENVKPANRLKSLYARFNGRQKISEEIVDPSDPGLEEPRAELNTQLQADLKTALDSSFPQLEQLLQSFYPDEAAEVIRKRELLLLRGVGQYLRLERGAANRLKAIGGLALDSTGERTDEFPDFPTIRNDLQVSNLKAQFTELLLQYVTATSDECKLVVADIAHIQGETSYLEKVKQLEAQYESELTVLRTSEGVRKAEYRLWLSQRAGEYSRVAGSPEDEELIEKVEKVHQTTNRIAGVVLYGPPGTGKTERMIEANKRNGRGTRVISMHRHSDFAQLMGETPIFLSGMSAESGKMDRVKAFQHFLESEQDIKTAIGNPDVLQKLLKFAPETAQALEAGTKLSEDEEAFNKFVQELKMSMNEQLVSLFTSSEDDANKDEVWVRGEILRAIDDGDMALLDEGDKAPPSAFDGISAILSKRPGEHLQLGGKEVQFPHWFRVDMNVNKNTLPEHMRDRFMPVECKYPQAEDLLWKVGLMLSDEQGEIAVDLETEWQMTILFSYVVPKIQELYGQLQAQYESKVTRDPNLKMTMRPFSLRGVSTFCNKIRAGEPIDKVIEEEFLEPNKLADKDSDAYKQIQLLISNFRRLGRELVIANGEKHTPAGIDRIQVSPIFGAISGSESLQVVGAERTLRETTVDPTALSSLKQKEQNPKLATPYRLPSGVQISLANTDSGVKFTYSYQAGNNTVPFFESSFSFNVAEIVSADNLGENLVLRMNDGTQALVSPMGGVFGGEKLGVSLGQSQQIEVSKNGQFIVTQSGGEVQVRKQNNGKLKELQFVDNNGQKLKTKSFSMSQDGQVVVLHTVDSQVLVCFPEREFARAASSTEDTITVPIETQKLPVQRPSDAWQVTGDLIWDPNTAQAFVVS